MFPLLPSPPRRSSAGVAASLNSANPDRAGQGLLVAIKSQIAAGRMERAVEVLFAHRDELEEPYPLLQELLEEVIVTSLGGTDSLLEGAVVDAARRLFYVLRVQDQYQTLASGENLTPEEVKRSSREAVIHILHEDTDSQELQQALTKLLSRSLLELIWKEAARRTILNGGEFMKTWIIPDGIDLFLDMTYQGLANLPKLTTADLIFAYAGFPHLITKDEDCDSLRGRIGNEAVLPRLIFKAWPEAVPVIIQEVGDDQTLLSGGRIAIVNSLIQLQERGKLEERG